MHLLLKWLAKVPVFPNSLQKFPGDIVGSSRQTCPVLCMRAMSMQGACEHATDEYLAVAAPSAPVVDLVGILLIILPSRAMGTTIRPQEAAPITVSARP